MKNYIVGGFPFLILSTGIPHNPHILEKTERGPAHIKERVIKYFRKYLITYIHNISFLYIWIW